MVNIIPKIIIHHLLINPLNNLINFNNSSFHHSQQKNIYYSYSGNSDIKGEMTHNRIQELMINMMNYVIYVRS